MQTEFSLCSGQLHNNALKGQWIKRTCSWRIENQVRLRFFVNVHAEVAGSAQAHSEEGELRRFAELLLFAVSKYILGCESREREPPT
jgi:hypothetical protein